MLDICGIMDSIPHRYPFLLLDRVIEMEPAKRILAIKCITFKEQFFQGHFLGVPVMPGVLVVEAMAQAGAVLLLHDMPDRENKLVYFAGIDKARFRRPVVPGDQLVITSEVVKLRSSTCKMQARAEVDGKVVTQAELMCALVDRKAGQ